MKSRWGRTGFRTAGEAINWHRNFVEGEIDNLELVRHWIADALDSRTLVHEQYLKMAWDLDGDIARSADAFSQDPEGGYSPEEANRDLQRVWRHLMLRYAFREAHMIEGRITKQEQLIWKRMTPKQQEIHGHPLIAHFWRWKDRLVWRMGVAVLAGYALLASSGGLVTTLEAIDKKWPVWPVLTAGLMVSFFLAMVEVERRVGWRPWVSVLGRRAASLTMRGAFWAAIGIPVNYLGARSLCLKTSSGLVLLYAASALLLGHIFQLFWQEKGIAEPW